MKRLGFFCCFGVGLFCFGFVGFGWFLGGLHYFFFNISTVLPVILTSQLYFQYVLCALLEFLPVHLASIISPM